MKKTKILSLILAILFIFFAVASGSDEEEATKDQGKDVAETTAATNNASLGDYEVEILSCRLSEDYEGKAVAIVKYSFTNVSDDEAASFMWTFSDKVYQNGIECESAILVEDDTYDSSLKDKEIKAGATLEVECAYVLNDTTTPIEVEVTELISFDETKITKTFEIA